MLCKQVSFSIQEKSQALALVPKVKEALLNNCKKLSCFPEGTVLIVGDMYPGIWLEHNQDNLFIIDFAPKTAWYSQEIFIKNQRKDGLIPYMATLNKREIFSDIYPDNYFGYWQIQSVYPLTRCAFEIAKKTNRPEEDLLKIFNCGTAYDNWLMANRNTMKTGLVEMFCEFDTGHDNSPRVTDGGIPHCCYQDAKNLPNVEVLPIISVDLSAMLYGNRTALAELATALGKTKEAVFWEQKARETRQKIKELLYDRNDDFYYDRNKDGLRKYKTEHITRLFLNKVLTQEEFDSIYARYFTIQNQGFCSPYPIPAVAIDDPSFDHTCPKNSWACNTQALTTLRAILWMDYYKRNDDLTALLSNWLKAILTHPQTTFQQEIHPFNGSPVGQGVNYTPTLLIFLEAIKRLGWQ